MKTSYDINYLGDLEKWIASHTIGGGVDYVLNEHFYFGLILNHRSIPLKSNTEETSVNNSNNCVKSIREIDLSIHTYGAFIDFGYINQVNENTSLFVKLRFRPYNYYRSKTRKSNLSTQEFNSDGICENLNEAELVYSSNQKIQSTYHNYDKGFYFPIIPDLLLGIRKKLMTRLSMDLDVGFGLGNTQPIQKPRLRIGASIVYTFYKDEK